MYISSFDLWRRTRALRSRATGKLLIAIARSARRVLLWPWRVAQARRELRILMSLSERQLRDIGVTQYDLVSAANLPFGEDPSEFIAQAVSERRCAQTAQGRAARVAGCGH